MKELLQKVLKNYRLHHNHSFQNAPIEEIHITSGIKPSRYYVPAFFTRPDGEVAYYLEIWFDDVCIWRLYKTDRRLMFFSPDELKKLEEELVIEMVSKILDYGIAYSHSIQKQIHNGELKNNHGTR